jgi:hypothetical protein
MNVFGESINEKDKLPREHRYLCYNDLKKIEISSRRRTKLNFIHDSKFATIGKTQQIPVVLIMKFNDRLERE